MITFSRKGLTVVGASKPTQTIKAVKVKTNLANVDKENMDKENEVPFEDDLNDSSYMPTRSKRARDNQNPEEESKSKRAKTNPPHKTNLKPAGPRQPKQVRLHSFDKIVCTLHN